ncbi:hypothetical protein LC0644_1623 [Lacticaseibacillus paracasei NRIC 0644]|uniref:Uncharacterized protein n=1 Tax=Lacticaseibacillus paracasei NRIC 0644 TaxID=1435038 RepID=A0A0C9PXX4_LACPA|nr:hypothetical protein LC0644_1623 [Lacticaseibacillus paracasei NRIC 0644]
MATKQLCEVTPKKKARPQLIVPDWLVIIDNHGENCYSIFRYMQRLKAKLVKNYEIAIFERLDEQSLAYLNALTQY